MHSKLTLVFYQAPDALPYIEMWKQTMYKNIEDFVQLQGDFIFWLKNGEVLYITTISDPAISDIQLFKDKHNLKFLKTLVFGKVTEQQLKDIALITKLFSNEK